MLEASSSLGSTKLIATRAYQSSDLKTDLKDLKPAQRARKALTTPGSVHAETASVVIRVWTLCIIRSVPEQRQTDPLGSGWFDAAKLRLLRGQFAPVTSFRVLQLRKAPENLAPERRPSSAQRCNLCGDYSFLGIPGTKCPKIHSTRTRDQSSRPPCPLNRLPLNSGTGNAVGCRSRAANSSGSRRRSGCCRSRRGGWRRSAR